MKKYRGASGKIYNIDPEPIAKGGEGFDGFCEFLVFEQVAGFFVLCLHDTGGAVAVSVERRERGDGFVILAGFEQGGGIVIVVLRDDVDDEHHDERGDEDGERNGNGQENFAVEPLFAGGFQLMGGFVA
mgnify:CR=1 FL=1